MKKVNKKLMKKWQKRRNLEGDWIDEPHALGLMTVTQRYGLFTLVELFNGHFRIGVGITKRSPLDGEDQKRANTIATWRALDNAAGV